MNKIKNTTDIEWRGSYEIFKDGQAHLFLSDSFSPLLSLFINQILCC